MGCCSKKKGNKSKKQAKGAPKKGGKKSVAAANKSGKSGASSKSASSKRVTPGKGATSSSKTPSGRVLGAKGPGAKGPGAKGPGAKGPGAKGPGAKSAPPNALQRATPEKRITKTPSSISSTKSGKSGSSIQSSGNSWTKSGPVKRIPVNGHLAGRKENRPKQNNKAPIQTNNTQSFEEDEDDVKKHQPGKVSVAPKMQQQQQKGAAIRPPPKGDDRKQKPPADNSTSGSKTDSHATRPSGRTPHARGVDRSKLPLQKLTISSHVEDGIVVSQWYYTELRELGTQPSSVADLLQGGGRQQLNLPQQQ